MLPGSKPAASPPSSRTSAIQHKRLATQLRQLRESAGLTIDQVAEALECSSSKISRIETGQVTATPRDVRDILALYGVETQLRDALVQTAREARQQGWWHQYRDLPGIHLVGLEAAASSLRIYEMSFVPALLQTEEYARATSQAVRPNLTEREIARRAELQVARQRLLSQSDPPAVWAVIDEAALRRQVGGSEAMNRQIERIQNAVKLPTVTIQVLPFDVGEHAGMNGAFTIISFPDAADTDIVYMDNAIARPRLEEANAVQQYTLLFDHIRASALSPTESMKFLQGL
jgi:transcriptional regulator with XRE-family HTH domain